MATPFVKMIECICVNLQVSHQEISSSQRYFQIDQPIDEGIDMLSKGIKRMQVVIELIDELKETSSRMNTAIFNATTNIDYASGLLEMLANTMPERQHVAMEALSSFTITAHEMLDAAWDLPKAAVQAMEDEA